MDSSAFSLPPLTHPRPGAAPFVTPEGIVCGTDGKYRWVYEPDRRALLIRLLGCLPPLILLCLAAFGNDLLLPGLMSGSCALVCILKAGTLILHTGGGCLLFTMDACSISRSEVVGRIPKDQVIHAFAVWVGGQSQPSLRFRRTRHLDLHAVRRIHVCPRKDRIALRCGLTALLLRTSPEQREVIFDHLSHHCPRAKIFCR